MVKLFASVGALGVNAHVDVTTVQNLLNQSIRLITPLPRLSVTGICDSLTIEAINQFQRRVVKLPAADGRVDPGGQTLRALVTTASGGTFVPGLGAVAGVPAGPAHKPNTPYTDSPNEAITKTTKPDTHQLMALARAAWSELSEQGARTLAAQCLHETKNGNNCYNWNLGNVKATTDRVLHMYLRGVWELFSKEVAQTLVAHGKGLVRIGTAEEHDKRTQSSLPVVMFDPPHSAARFLAFRSLPDGVTYWIGRHKAVASKHSDYLETVNAGKCRLVAHTLKMTRYYTGNEGEYAAGMTTFKAQLDRTLGPAT